MSETHLQISPQYIEQEKLHQIEETKRRASLFLGACGGEYDLNDKTVILVDDGAATGATIIVAASSTRMWYKVFDNCLTLAPKNTVNLLKRKPIS
jgi:putative phosphoribosyl transferase